MSFKEIVEAQVANAFDNILENDLEDVYYESIDVQGAHNPLNPNASNPPSRIGTMKMVIAPYGALFGADPNLIKEAFSGDLLATIQNSELTKFNIKPKNGDRIIRLLSSGEEVWEIKGLRPDPFFVTYQFLITKR